MSRSLVRCVAAATLCTAVFLPGRLDARVPTKGIWITPEEIMALPTTGAAWDALLAQANLPAGTPNVSDQNQPNNVYVLAKALVYVRTGIESYRTEVVQNCMAAIDTELDGETLALGRELAAYVIAADLVGLDEADDVVFRAWLRRTLTEVLANRTLQSTHEVRPNNWGTLAGGSRAAVAVYLDDTAELARTAQVFKGWLGDRSSYVGFSFQFGSQGADTWMPDPSQPRPVNPAGSAIDGHNVDGALPDDISRGCTFRWPPCQTGYPWEGLAGAVMQAEILARRGYDAWNWENQAIRRAVEYLWYLDQQFGGWWTDQDDEQWIPWVVNHAYGTSYRTHLTARIGKNMAWTDWTHAAAAPPPPPLAPAITSFAPNGGLAGTPVVLTGVRFTGATAVAFNGTSANPFTVSSDAQIQTSVPAGATSGRITVTGPGGTGTSATDFAVWVSPTLTVFTPSHGVVGSQVTLGGSGFVGSTSVTVGGVSGSFTVDSDTQIRVTVPTGATTGPIVITNPVGTSTSASPFVVDPPPTSITIGAAHDARVVSNSPTSNYGTTTPLRVRSVDPTYYSFLKFNVTGLSGTVVSAKVRLYCVDDSPDGGRVYAVSNDYLGTTTPWVESGLTYNNAPVVGGTPLDTKGAVPINSWVEFNVTPALSGNGVYSFGFWSGSTNIAGYNAKEAATNRPELVIEQASATAPSIAFFSPGSATVGALVTVGGSGFSSTSSVKFSGIPASFIVDSDAQLRATVPAGASTGPITVTNAVGTATSPTSFTVLVPPAIVSFSPVSGLVGTEITVTGVAFTGATAVAFNGTAASYTVDNDTQIRTTVPAGATTGVISVTNGDGTGSSATPFTIVEPPSLTSFTPTSGPVGTQVTLLGSAFGGATGVTFNGVSASYTVDSQAQVRATVPAGATSGPVAVTTPYGTATSVTAFTVLVPPVIASFTPESGLVATEVTVTGTAFTGATAVAFSSTAASFTVDSDTQIRATVPTGATTGAISVTNGDGTGTSATPFTILVPPSITSFAPLSGAAGAEVTIAGTAFTGTTAVKFNGAPAGFTVDSDTQVTATVPASATTGPIAVTNSDGTGTSAADFTILVPPTVASFAPSSGIVGTEVTLVGAAFTGATAVTFNAVSASFTVDDDAQIRALVPDGASTGPISVTNGDGTGTGSTDFTVLQPPSLTSFTPTSGVVGAEVTILGSAFTGTTDVTFNGEPASFTVDSDVQVTATVPVGAGSGPIALTNPLGTATSTASFTVLVPPGIASFTPESGLVGVEVTVTGTAFTGATAVAFNGTAASFTVDSDTQLRATVPAGATTGPISVTNGDGTGSSATSFAVLVPPTLASFTPASGAVGTEVTILGAAFSGTTAVTFNGVLANHTVDSGLQIRATVPAGATSGPIAVTTAVGTATSATSFTVLVPPVIASFTPPNGAVGTEVTVIGTAFSGATAVAFNGTAASFTVHSDSEIRAIVPAGATAGRITVTNPDGTGTSAADFSVLVPPSIVSFTPASGPVGTQVTIAGSNFTGTSSVTFNNIAASFTVDSGTQIRATVPAGAATGPIRITNLGGTTTSTSNFTVTVPPTSVSFSPTDDARVVSNSPSSNYGSVTPLRVKGSNPITNSYLKFNVTGVSGTVVSAKLRLYCSDDSPSGGGAYVVSNSYLGTATPWVEGGLTYSNAPAIGGTALEVKGAVGLNTWVEFNVTAAITGDGVHSFAISGGSSNVAGYHSKEATTNRPQLVIEQTPATVPSIASFSPTSGSVGQSVTILGSRFTNATAVTFNGVSASFLVDSDAQLRATVPAGATTGRIAVTNLDGTGTSATDFTIPAPPSIASFTPSSGPYGAQVTILGTSFSGATGVVFNGVAASFTVDSDAQLRAVVPNGATTGRITVTNPLGFATSTTDFVVTAPPTSLSFSPTDDARVDSSNPAINYGSVTPLRVRSTNPVLNSYLKFDVAGLSGTVVNAKLRLYCVDNSSSGGSAYGVANAYLGTSTPWVESGLTYGNAPAITGSPLDVKGSVANNTWVEFNVTLAITGNGTYSFALSGGSTNIAGYNSKEAATNRPQLVIEQTSGAAPASASAAAEEKPVEEDPAVHGLALPREIALRQNYPNPFTSYTHLRFDLPRASQVRLRIYDVMGRAVKTLVDQQTAPGVHEISWDGRDQNGRPLSSGVYLLRMETPEMSLTRRVLLAR